MSPTSWTEVTANATPWQSGLSTPSLGTVDFIFGAFAITQPEFLGAATNYAEVTVNATPYTEVTAPAATWTEVSG